MKLSGPVVIPDELLTSALDDSQYTCEDKCAQAWINSIVNLTLVPRRLREVGRLVCREINAPVIPTRCVA